MPTDVPSPVPGQGEVVIEVAAISINPVDVKVRDLDAVATMICGDTRPLTIGWDVAGTVRSVGDGVTRFAVGDRVFGMVDFPGQGGGYAEQVAAAADQLAPVPDGVTFPDAAASTLAALTAYQLLAPRVRAGDQVLIHAGSGGVGHFAIQLAKAAGAHVTTTCSTANRDFVLGLGADAHVDYREVAFDQVLHGMDFVLDALGGDNVARCLSVTKDGGSVVSLPAPDFDDAIVAAAAARGIELAFHLVTSSGDDMATLAGLLAEGTLRPHVSQTLAFDDMDAAHAAVRSGRTVGKLVVTVSG